MTTGEPHAMDWVSAAETIDRFLQVFVSTCGMELTFQLSMGSGSERVRLSAIFSGPDARLLVARNAELLRAMESLATSMLRLDPEDHDLISFDAEEYKAKRALQMQHAAEIAVSSVRTKGQPYSFPPMNSRERRMLHLELAKSGLRTASSGDEARRFVVLYPPEQDPGLESPVDDGAGRAKVIRNAFRPR